MEGESIIIRFIAETEGCPYLYHAKLIAGSHHEKWNGSGYPRGLKGEDIPLAGRVMAFVDAYDALTSERPYKKPYSMSEVERIIYKNTRIQFDPAIVKVFFNVKDRFAEYVEGPVN
jgi:putative two-component system response regulator